MRSSDVTSIPMSMMKWLLCLIAISSLTLTACQRAKMQPIPRQSPGAGQGATEPTPPEETKTPEENNQPPVILPPVDSGGEGGDEPPPEDPPDIVPVPYEPPPVQPSPAPSGPVTPQPTLPNHERNVIPWLDPNAPAHPSVLNRCAWENCDDPIPPRQREEKQGRPYTQTSEPITNKLDILFVVDTSNSLDDERAAIARNMDRFINEVSKISQRSASNLALDYQIGVLLAHGPNSPLTSKQNQSAHGNLFVHKGEDLITNPVLKSSDMHEELLKSTLLARFNGNGNITSIRDQSNTQGEAGLLSLSTYLQKELKSPSGFPRSDAALMVIFVSDENDVCYDYKSKNAYYANVGIRRTDSPQVHSTKKVELDGIMRDKPEHEAFINECEHGSKGQAHTIVNLLKTIKNHSEETHANLPIIPTAVVYRTKGEQQQAQARKQDFYGDNEMGLGYLDVVNELGKGMATSLLTDDFGKQLANIGKEALFDLNFYNSLPIASDDGNWVDLKDVSNSEIRVEVEVKEGAKAGQIIQLVQDEEYTIQRSQADGDESVHGRVLLQNENREQFDWDNAVIRTFYKK